MNDEITNFTIFLIILILFTETFGKITLPPFLKICNQSNIDIDQCIMESIESLRPLLAKGIPEFNIPRGEPLEIPEVEIDQGTGAVSLKSTYRNIQVYGASDFLLKTVRIDLEKGQVHIKIWLPKLQVNTNYSMKGQILLMPIIGSGRSFGNYNYEEYIRLYLLNPFPTGNIDATITMKIKTIPKDENDYYNVEECSIDFNIGDAELRFDNLFNGNKELGETMNKFLNDNWKTIANEVQPVLEDKLAELFKNFANKIFHKFPASMLFPA